MKTSSLKILFILALALSGCESKQPIESKSKVLFPGGKYPNIEKHNGMYHFIMQAPPVNTISIYSSTSLDSISSTSPKIVWEGKANKMDNIWSSCLRRMGDRWYIYFEADNGNTDNHQIYVIENPNDNPTEGEWTLHGPIITNREWNFGIHPSTVIVNGKQYLLWSGWEHRRVEAETQCIFIAEMENPWTLKSERVMISQPEYEWERQWINPDGSRSAYPIFVNEDPEAFVSPDNKNIVVAYSASGIWTRYNTLGIIYAPTSANLLDKASWTKMEEPQFRPAANDTTIFGSSNISVLTESDGATTLLYQAKHLVNGFEESDIYYKTITWDEQSLPVFGNP